MIDEAGVGVVLYVHNKARSSLSRSFERQLLRIGGNRASAGASEALRDFGLGAQVLAELGLRKIQLLSNSERKIVGIEGFGIEVVRRVPVDHDDGRRLNQIAGGPAPGAAGGSDDVD
jgi:3,4-dihydroxy 2-butanone 4-phosphate synthase/GTP cyclohydrolase II